VRLARRRARDGFAETQDARLTLGTQIADGAGLQVDREQDGTEQARPDLVEQQANSKIMPAVTFATSSGYAMTETTLPRGRSSVESTEPASSTLPPPACAMRLASSIAASARLTATGDIFATEMSARAGGPMANVITSNEIAAFFTES